MNTKAAQLREFVAEARRVGATGSQARLLTDAATALIASALEATVDPTGLALVAPYAATRDPLDETLLASASGRVWVISGEVGHVSDATDATALLTVVRSRPFAGRERGLRVYLVDVASPGLHMHPLSSIDDDHGARVVFDAVQVGEDRAVGPSRDASRAIAGAIDAATLVAVSEMLGAADAARRNAMAWVQQRVQFGEPLAAKQAVAHRVADMTVACDAVGLLVDHALATADDGDGVPDPLAVCTAKIAANMRLPMVTAHAHQLHGGEGFYADQPLHRWHRRVTALAMAFGDRRALLSHQSQLLGLSPDL